MQFYIKLPNENCIRALKGETLSFRRKTDAIERAKILIWKLNSFKLQFNPYDMKIMVKSPLGDLEVGKFNAFGNFLKSQTCTCTPGDPCDYHMASCIVCPNGCEGHPPRR